MSRFASTSRTRCAQCVRMMRRNGQTISGCRAFSSTIPQSLNPLLNLSGLAFSKEAQYFSKERKIPREEYSSNLQLIRSSEVDPFAPSPGASPTVLAALRRAQRGESDMQTAYSLAISNLLVQLESARVEAKQTTEALGRLQEKHKTQERHALLMMLGIATFLSISLFKPDAFEQLKRDVDAGYQRWSNIDWQWLGNPPKYKTTTAASGVRTPENDAGTVLEIPLTQAQSKPLDLPDQDATSSSTSKYLDGVPSWTRLFWAS